MAQDRKAAEAAEDAPTGLAALIAGAGKKDLDEIARKIAEIDERVGKLKNQRAGLVSVEKAVGLVVHGRPAAAPRKNSRQKDERINTIEQLLGDGKRRSASTIAEATAIPVGSVHAVLKDARFARQGDGWTLSKKAS